MAGTLVVGSVWYRLLFRRRQPHFVAHLVLTLVRRVHRQGRLISAAKVLIVYAANLALVSALVGGLTLHLLLVR